VDEPLDTDEDEEDLAPARLTVGFARRLRLLVIDATEGVGEVLVRWPTRAAVKSNSGAGAGGGAKSLGISNRGGGPSPTGGSGGGPVPGISGGGSGSKSISV